MQFYLSGKSLKLGFAVNKQAKEMGREVKDRIPPEKAMEILQKGGLQVDIEQARQILDFLYKLIDIVLSQFELPP